ncbi:UNVERIFIED_CONTAM: Mitogen-activated protein kinase kinase [Sesamum radiatum]|uniref:Mitogen-activated protein kinase kinase n=1 Tax=Sesamum radiatum TaxID=300843 RepID=A0AAW2VNK2_SESRA
MSPERFDPDTYGANYDGYAGDIWSLGLAVLELYLGHFPYLPPGERPDWATLMCAICFGEPPTLPESASENFSSFIECCLQKDSSKRWSATQLLSHPFVSNVEDLNSV